MHQRFSRNSQHQARESMEEFVRRYKLECKDVKGAPECMKISGFMHEITNPELIKRLHDKIPNSVDEMMRVTTTFLRGEVVASNLGHTTDECMYPKRQFEEMLKARKLSHLIKELKLSNGKDQEKVAKNGETLGKDKPLAILMVQPCHRVAKQRITQTFSLETVISFPLLGEEDETEGPMIIKGEIGGHFVHHMYVDGGSSSEILYEHHFNRLCLEVRSQMVLAATPLVTISIQRNHRKAGGKEDTGSPIHSSRNAKKTQVAIHPEYPKQTIAIGSTLTEEGRKKLCGLLRRNLDIFAWMPADMTGVPRHIAEHMLNIRERCIPIRQKKKGQAPGRNKAIYKEVEKLVKAGSMKEDLNKACPKDGYPLPEIEWKVESLCRSGPQSAISKVFEERTKTNWEGSGKPSADFVTNQPKFSLPSSKLGEMHKGNGAKDAISEFLMTKRDGNQMPIYFVSRALQGPEINYTPMEKLILALDPWILFPTDLFDTTNNEAEYEALIAGVRIAEQMGVKNLHANVDSRLVANQVNGTYIAKEPGIIKYLEKVRTLHVLFKVILYHTSTIVDENKKADTLSKMTSTGFAHLSKQVLVEELKEKSIDEKEVLAVVEEEGRT
ncbi:reverse transcriptase domain-containing protein [Tanacetum coccineum]